MTVEKTCSYSVVARIEGTRTPVSCDRTKCLRNLVWNGKGIKNAVSEVLNIPVTSVSEAWVEGDFIPCPEAGKK